MDAPEAGDYPWQLRFAAWLAEQPPGPTRRILSWPTGSGKSKSALLAARTGAVLIVAPALAVGAWEQQCALWLDERPGVYDKSAARKVLSKKERARLAEALAARVLLTTPHFAFVGDELAEWVRCAAAGPGGLTIILDEGDMYANPLVERSEGMRRVLALAPQARVLLLTATLFPKEIRDVWNPVQALFPTLLPPPRADTGGVPFQFLVRYANRDINGYFKGTRPAGLDSLRGILERGADIVSEAEVLRHVPPVQIHGLAGDDRTPGRWLNECAERGARSIVMVSWTRAQAEEFGRLVEVDDRFGAVDVLHGGVPTRERWKRLQALRKAYREGERVALCCTADSFLTAVSLAFFERGLLTQWRTTPRQVIQHIGRYRRPDPDKRVPTVLDLLVEDGQATGEVQSRLAAFQRLLGASANAQGFADALAEGVAAGLNVEFTAAEVMEMFAPNDNADALSFFESDEDDDL